MDKKEKSYAGNPPTMSETVIYWNIFIEEIDAGIYTFMLLDI